MIHKVLAGENTKTSNLIEQLSNIASFIEIIDDDEPEIEVNFDNISFVDPTKLALITCFVRNLSQSRHTTVNCINCHLDNENYISRMNFFDLVDFDYQEQYGRNAAAGRFIPIQVLTEETQNELHSEIMNVMSQNWTGIDDTVIGCLSYAINEITYNVFNHSKSTLGGVITAQYYARKNLIRLAIIDSGIGIPSSLRKNSNYYNFTDVEAVEKALEHNVSWDETLTENFGAGLYFSKRIVEANHGKLSIYSNNAKVTVDQTGVSATPHDYWCGTAVFFDINTDNTLDIDDVFLGNVSSIVEDYVLDGHLW
ncbi:ATP-binding protein [Alkalihalophilus marmarensis]|uniref:ATP-binding protein n=1 Tax=Alkalihalophilus marmarensis TaxID=521377 RepID=UPI002E1A608D|nr:ATP-binding protein [Alkalihalophilus marmarensis]